MMDEYLEFEEEQRAKDLGYTHAQEGSRSMEGKVLAELLGVAPASLSGAAKNDHLCQGYRVAKWAIRDRKGTVISYHVPNHIYEILSDKSPIDNPEPNQPNSADIKEIEPSVPDQKNSGTGFSNTGTISLLPPNQNYVEPVVAGSIGLLGKSIIEKNTPTSLAIMFAASAGVGSFMGYKFSNDNWFGALIGALMGLGTAYLGNSLYYKNEKDQEDFFKAENKSSNLGDISSISPNQPNSAPSQPVKIPVERNQIIAVKKVMGY